MKILSKVIPIIGLLIAVFGFKYQGSLLQGLVSMITLFDVLLILFFAICLATGLILHYLGKMNDKILEIKGKLYKLREIEDTEINRLHSIVGNHWDVNREHLDLICSHFSKVTGKPFLLKENKHKPEFKTLDKLENNLNTNIGKLRDEFDDWRYIKN